MSDLSRIILISDIHGHKHSFQKVLDQIGLNKADRLYVLGDLIDRGPDSKGVIDEVIQLQKNDYQVYPSLGNHEDMMLEAYEGDEDDLNLWFRNGGKETLASFDAASPKEIPAFYIDYIKNWPIYFSFPQYIFVHAGLKFSGFDPLSNIQAMLWIRNWYNRVDYNWMADTVLVHGHTPITVDDIKRMLSKLDETLIINIDAGCYKKGRFGYGQLCALDLTNRKLYFQENVG